MQWQYGFESKMSAEAAWKSLNIIALYAQCLKPSSLLRVTYDADHRYLSAQISCFVPYEKLT